MTWASISTNPHVQRFVLMNPADLGFYKASIFAHDGSLGGYSEPRCTIWLIEFSGVNLARLL
jgi:hypothetical protein